MHREEIVRLPIQTKKKNKKNLSQLRKENKNLIETIKELEGNYFKPHSKIIKTLKFEKNNFKCWWCLHDFDNVNHPIPSEEKDNGYKCYGNFCSHECAYAYLLNKNSISSDKEISLLKEINYKMYQNKKLSRAPPRESLKILGGFMSIKEFRHNNKKVEMYLPPMYPIYPIFQVVSKI